jgi:C4-type Zn-finger protein
MAKCPTCGNEVETPTKEWNIGRDKKVRVKQYECCGKRFREYGKKV